MSPIPVILLRPNSRSCATSSPDPYAHLLSQPSSSSRSTPSYTPYFVPVLDTEFVDQDGLQEVYREGSEKWGGVVVTSQRAVEAWGRAGEVVEGEGAAVAAGKGKGKAREVEALSPSSTWATLHFFSIGPSTTNALLSLSFNVRPPPELILSPSNAGNTPSLADLIASHFSSSSRQTSSTSPSPSISTPPSKPLLYLTGDKNSPLLSQLLLSSSPPILLQPRQTYLTSPLPTFIPTFSSLLCSIFEREATSRKNGKLPWVVLFSPSAVELAMAVLNELDAFRERRVRFAVIGPTTGDALRKELETEGGGQMDVLEAGRPGAAGLVEVLRKRDGLM